MQVREREVWGRCEFGHLSVRYVAFFLTVFFFKIYKPEIVVVKLIYIYIP